MTLTKIVLSEQDIPTHWYNLNADLPAAGIELPPVLHPGTGQPIGPADLAPLFPMALIAQEVSTERYIEIPEEVRDIVQAARKDLWSAIEDGKLSLGVQPVPSNKGPYYMIVPLLNMGLIIALVRP